MSADSRILITGGGGFIGGHLVKRLLDDGHDVRAVDIKPIDDWWQVSGSHNLPNFDLRRLGNCLAACDGVDHVYQLAAFMGGIGCIETHRCDCAMNVVLSANILRAAHESGVDRLLYSSSACVYHADRQHTGDSPLSESDAYYNGGAMPEDGYGWEKLFTERLCRHWREDCGLQTRIARLHNIYGPHGSWTGGREKAPAAMCRKVAEAKFSGATEIEVWGDGAQTRSFCWIDDCVEGLIRLMDCDYHDPVNLGSEEMVTIDGLIGVVEEAAEYSVGRKHDTTKPQGVAGRNSDNRLIRDLLDWEPLTPLEFGISQTYPWIEQQVRDSHV